MYNYANIDAFRHFLNSDKFLPFLVEDGLLKRGVKSITKDITHYINYILEGKKNHDKVREYIQDKRD